MKKRIVLTIKKATGMGLIIGILAAGSQVNLVGAAENNAVENVESVENDVENIIDDATEEIAQAEWRAVLNDYTVRYFANDGAREMTFDEEKGEYVPKEAEAIAEYGYDKGDAAYAAYIDEEVVKEGFAFVGWAKDAEATEPDYFAGDEMTLDGNLDLYAVWEDASTVKFDVKYVVLESTFGDAPFDERAPYAYGEEADLMFPWGLANGDLQFLGWSTNPFAKEAEYTFDELGNATAEITKNLKLYAVWGD